MSQEMLPSTPCNPVNLCTCKFCLYIKWLRTRCINKKIHYFTFDQGQGHTKCCSVPSTSYDLCICNVCSCYVQWFKRCIYKKQLPWLPTHRQTDRQRTDLGTKLIYPSSTVKLGIIMPHQLFQNLGHDCKKHNTNPPQN